MNRITSMAQLLPSRRRAEEFARALEGPARAGNGGPLVEPHLQSLLDTAARLSAVPVVEPRAEFRASLRDRLLEAAVVELRAEEPGPAGAADLESAPVREGAIVDDVYAARRRRRLVAAATGFVLVGGGTGVAAASEQALPGDMLYPIKRTLEIAEVSLAQGADDEGRALLERATTRLDEAQALSTTPDAAPTEADLEGIERALTDFTSDAAGGGEQMLDAYAASGDPADLRVLRDFAAASHEDIRELADDLPPESQPELRSAGDVVVALDDRAMQACPDCTTATPLLPLQLSAISLPELDADASPYFAGREPLLVRDLDQAHSGGQSADRQRGRGLDRNGDLDRDPRRGSSEGARGPAPAPAPGSALPEVDLGGPAGKQPASGADDATHVPVDGAEPPRQPPELDVGDVLDTPAPPPSRAPRTTDGPGVDDVGGTVDEVRKKSGDTAKKTDDVVKDSVEGAGETLDDPLGEITERVSPLRQSLATPDESPEQEDSKTNSPDVDVPDDLL